MVHRLLAAAIGADATYPELMEKKKIQEICNNINFRHRMGQYAGRASVTLHTQVWSSFLCMYMVMNYSIFSLLQEVADIEIVSSVIPGWCF